LEVICGVIDAILLAAVRKGSERALGQLIDKYTAYVCAIIRNSVGSTVSREDIEEVASDVFLALWENAANIRGNPKAYLGAAARNKAKNKLRGLAPGVPLTEDYAADGGITLEDGLMRLTNAELSSPPY
jgi:RNA polymerase sigma-70 factor (ECF subfamily)